MPWPPTARALRALTTLALLAALFSPVVRDRDGLPLSTYPMYSSARGPEASFVTAQVVAGADVDDVSVLTPDVIGESGDALVVTGDLRAALAVGDADRRCAAIAARALVTGLAATGDSIELVEERHDTVARLTGDDSLLERRVAARCEVGA